MAKLTLHVDDDLIVAAKKEAASRDTSVSKLVSGFFRALSATPSRRHEGEVPPVTASLIGCARGADADQEAHIDYLEKKHS